MLKSSQIINHCDDVIQVRSDSLEFNTRSHQIIRVKYRPVYMICPYAEIPLHLAQLYIGDCLKTRRVRRAIDTEFRCDMCAN